MRSYRRTAKADRSRSGINCHGDKNMPRGPKGEKRPADVIGNAVKVMNQSETLVRQEAGEIQPAKVRPR